MGFFSSGGSTQTSNSYSGLRGLGLNGDLWNTGKGSAGDYSFLSNASKDYFNSPMPTLNSNGLYDSQMAGVNQLAQQMFGNVSGDYASRGLLTPDNLGGVVGSAVTAASPQLMSMIASNIQQQEAMKTNRFQPLLNTLGQAPGLLGNQTQSTMTQTNPGLGYSMLNGAVGGASQGLGYSLGSKAAGGTGALMCWIAEALYGASSLKTHLARLYVHIILPLTEAGRQFKAWYQEYGRRIAAAIPGSPTLRAGLRPIFDAFVSRSALLFA